MTPAMLPALLAAVAVMSAGAGLRLAVADRAIGTSARVPRWSLGATAPGRDFAERLRRTGVGVSAETALAVVGLGTLLASLGVLWVTRSPILAVGCTCVTIGSAWSYLSSSDRRYLDRFAAQLPVVAQQLGNAVGAGLSLGQALRRAAMDAPEPAAVELGTIARDLALGLPVDEALERAVTRLPDPGFRIMVGAILVQRTSGGNLAGALTEFSARLDERASLDREARAATAQAKLSAWLVAGLPLGGGLMIELVAPGTLSGTLGQGVGKLLVFVAAVMQIVGVMIIRRLIRTEGR